MAKTIFVEVIGNASQFKKELTSAVASTEKANSGFARMGKTAMVAGGLLATGLAFGLEKSVKAAIDAEKSIAKLDQAFKDAHLSISQYKTQVDNAETASRKLGFTDDDTRNALARLVTATGNVKQAMTDLTLAQDVARLKGVDLQSAVQMVTSTLSGNVRAAKALGIVLLPVTSNVDALRAKYKELGEAIPPAELATAKLADKQATAANALQQVTDKVHGQADAYSQTAAGAMATFHAELQHIEETIGVGLLPVMTRLLGELNNLLAAFQKEIEPIKAATAGLRENKTAVEILGTAFHVLEVAALLPLREAMLIWRGELAVVRGAIAAVETVSHALASAFNAVKNAGSEVADVIRGALSTAFNVFRKIASGIESVINAIAGALRAVASAARDVASALSSIHVPHISIPGSGILGKVGGALSHIPHAAGGSVTAGATYLVGERGPELFTSGASGYITPNRLMGAGGGQVVINFPNYVGSRQELADTMRRELLRMKGRNVNLGLS